MVQQIKLLRKTGGTQQEFVSYVNSVAVTYNATKIEYLTPNLFHGSQAIIHYDQK